MMKFYKTISKTCFSISTVMKPNGNAIVFTLVLNFFYFIPKKIDFSSMVDYLSFFFS